MRNLFIPTRLLSAFLLILVLNTGCKKDLLNTVPNDRVSTGIFWHTEQDAIFASNAVYTYLGENANHYFSWDGMSDFGHNLTPQSPESFILKGQYDALNSRIADDWTNAYAGIRSANNFLENVDQVTTTNTALIARLKAEVRTIRAYLFTRLAMLYGDVPLVKTTLTLEQSKNLKRDPVSAIWDFVSAELADAAAVLPNTQTDKGRITKGAAFAIKARAMLFAGRWADAAAAAQSVMSIPGYGIYASYKNLFSYTAENNNEVVLDIQFVQSSYSNNIFAIMAPFSQKSSGSRYTPTKKMVDSYDMANGKPITDPTSGFDPANPYANRDPRLKYSVFVAGDTLPSGAIYKPTPGSGTTDAVGSSFQATNTGFNLKKYIAKEDYVLPANGGLNIILIRYAEVLLTYAEAKIEANQIDGSVLNAINLVRQRADVNMPAIVGVTDQATLRQIVRHERSVELAFEASRFFDIRRWKIADQVMPGKVQGMTYKNASNQFVTVEVPAWTNTFRVDRDYLWPIPQKERELNTNLTQNPNW